MARLLLPCGRTAARLVGVGVLLSVAAAIAPGAARAQPLNPCAEVRNERLGVDGDSEARCLDLQLFLPTANIGSTFTIDRPGVPRHMTFVLGVGASYATGVLRRAPVDDRGEPIEDESIDVVPSLAQIELLAAIGLFEFVEVGLAVPFAVASVPQDGMSLSGATVETESQAVLSDMRLSLKVPLLRGDFALAGRAVFSLPLPGDADQHFLSPGYWTMTPGAVMAYRAGPVTLAAEIALRLRRRAALGQLEQDDELHLAFGGSYRISDLIAVIAETQLRAGVGGRTMRSNEQPMEGDLGVRLTPVEGLNLDVGAGTGLLDGYGSPTFRGFLIARYATEEESCEAGPEDFDGFEDGDYCADLDNDADGLEDDDDTCPNDAEDLDGFIDEDGCPDVDNDADGVQDPQDRCPVESEDVDGFEDTDGCPEPDNDQDGINDGLDECPMQPEDRDAFQDEDGCPEPGPEQATITVTDTRILISERIYFDFDNDTIRAVSQPLLDQVADVINRLPGARRIRVEGYTDDAGESAYNTDLSYRRSRAVVEYLVGRGVARARLEYRGFGEQNPVAPNDTPDGRALNRRVEFTILEAGEGRRH